MHEFKSYPTKRLFVDTLSKDVSIVDALLDLIDNPVSSAISRDNVDVLQLLLPGQENPRFPAATVHITFSEDQIEIWDDCGGIKRKDAEERVFVFGAPEEGTNVPALSVYGIGMKRAFFKLGKVVEMVSHHKDDPEPFGLRWDIDVWLNDPIDWNIPGADPLKLGIPETDYGRTVVRISNLTPEAIAECFSPGFISDLRARIAVSYALFIQCGLVFKINGEQVDAVFPSFASSLAISSAVWSGAYEVSGIGHPIEVHLRVGLTPMEDKKPRGWYVICNGRVVLEGDKSDSTGWGIGGFPAFHVKYNHFFGWVYFRSTNVAALPWTSTKRGVSVESSVYRRALAEMRTQARPVTQFLNDMYPSDPEIQGITQRDALTDATSVTAFEKEEAQRGFTFTPPLRPPIPMTNVQLQLPTAQIREAARALDSPDLSARAVVRRAFDYFYKRECE